ncbi:hypothetical protein JQK88_32580 [Mesorhizobium caraganae]|uniref:hypothetical protein n=1 Tax=Mesorhizobium caraganae TaxID=483206 RepID=UPI001939A5F1|nr:hypothetical protein [Mesorhizobium caraganae]MBM2715848.1 hypothetical protein [Mesorhizobium caraganae]
MDLRDLLIECLDALRVPALDCNHRAEHLKRIEQVLENDGLPSEARSLLVQAAATFRRHMKRHPADFWFRDDRETGVIAQAIANYIGDDGFFYHGTVFRRLRSILDEGLVPGASRVWGLKGEAQDVLRQYVFFEPTWRGAVNWADTASRRAKGKKGTLARSPVIIRLPMRGLQAVRDPFARREDCLMVKGKVSAEQAEFTSGHVRGFARWAPLTEAMLSRFESDTKTLVI